MSYVSLSVNILVCRFTKYDSTNSNKMLLKNIFKISILGIFFLNFCFSFTYFNRLKGPCMNHACKNDATCIEDDRDPRGEEYVCLCRPGYSGRFCQNPETTPPPDGKLRSHHTKIIAFITLFLLLFFFFFFCSFLLRHSAYHLLFLFRFLLLGGCQPSNPV